MYINMYMNMYRCIYDGNGGGGLLVWINHYYSGIGR